MRSEDNSTVDNNGVVISFDFVVSSLKTYYSNKSPQGAYAVMERYFKKHGFEKLKDSDYKHVSMSEENAFRLMVDFTKENKWFPHCISKINLSPNVPVLDISIDIVDRYADKNWKNQKDKENLASNKSAENSKGKDILDFVNSHKADKNEINNKKPHRSTSNDRER